MGNTPNDEDDTTTDAAACFGLNIIESDSQESDNAEPAEAEFCEVWPEHWHALLLYLNCQSQREVALGGMGGVYCTPARSVNVQQELLWLDLPPHTHAQTVRLFREIERESLTILNRQCNSKG